VLTAAATLAAIFMATARPTAQPVAVKETTFMVERALQRLPYYGVFDFLAFGVDRGTVTLEGYAYQGSLKGDATRAVKRVSGVDEVTNTIALLPASQNDDRTLGDVLQISPTISCRDTPRAGRSSPGATCDRSGASPGPSRSGPIRSTSSSTTAGRRCSGSSTMKPTRLSPGCAPGKSTACSPSRTSSSSPKNDVMPEE
jgi:hypothetical protein